MFTSFCKCSSEHVGEFDRIRASAYRVRQQERGFERQRVPKLRTAENSQDFQFVTEKLETPSG